MNARRARTSHEGPAIGGLRGLWTRVGSTLVGPGLAGLLGLGGLTGCPSSTAGGGARRHAQEPSRSDLEGIELRAMKVQTDAPPVEDYGASVEHALSESEQAVAAAMAELPLTHLPALSRMTRALARHAPSQNTMPPSLVDGLMAWSGLPDPQPRLIVVEMPDDPTGCHRRIVAGCEPAVASLVEQVGLTLPDAQPLLFGVGVVPLDGGATRMLVAVLERAVELAPLPVGVERRGHVSLQGRLLGARTRPRLDVVGPSGQWRSFDVGLAADGRFSARVECVDGPGAYQIEVLADGAYGPEVVANFPVYCGVDPPDAIAMEVELLEPSVSAEQLARANFLYLNEERQRRGLPPLSWDPKAAQIAARHSRDMADNGYVGHRSPTTGEVMDRFDAAGVDVVAVRENVARGYGPKGIHESLMGSPGHRVNMLATDVTHVGVGVVVGEPETDMPGAARPILATQNFVRMPQTDVPVRDLVPTLRARVDARRTEEGLPAIGWDDQLSAIAQRFANAVGRGRPPPDGYDEAVFALGYTGVVSHRLSSPDFDALARAKLWSESMEHAGLGVVRTKARGESSEGFMAVILVAERE